MLLMGNIVLISLSVFIIAVSIAVIKHTFWDED